MRFKRKFETLVDLNLNISSWHQTLQIVLDMSKDKPRLQD